MADQEQFRERQRLLASLDREIKASPQYRSNQAAAGDASAHRSSYVRGPPRQYEGRQLVTYKEVKKALPDDEVDTYTSYHSETDPYKTQTTTSRMVNDPFLARARQPSAGTGFESLSGNHDPVSTNNHIANQSPETNYNTIQASQMGLHTGQQDKGSGDKIQAHQQHAGVHLLTGPLINYTGSNRISDQGDLLRNSNNPIGSTNNAGGDEGTNTNSDNNHGGADRGQSHSRVRRDDSDEREIDNDTDDDGVWVDDDEDDDNRQQSSDVNETAQHPEEEEEGDEDGQQDDASNNYLTPQQINPPGVIGAPHSYELSPHDMLIYPG